MRNKSAWRQAGDELLLCGPVSREELIQHMSKHVPTPYAISIANAKREHDQRYKLKIGKRSKPLSTPTGESDSKFVGSRKIARQCLRVAIDSGTWVKLPDGRIALNPEKHKGGES